MIIFGTRGVTLTGKPAPFYCPQCDGDRQYKRKTIRRFFTLYFIPLIPLDKLEEYIQCQTCRSNFRTKVIHYDPRAEREAAREQSRQDFRTILVHFAGLSGRRDVAFLQTVCDLYTQFDGGEINTAMVAQDLELTRKDLALETGRIRQQLSDQGRESVIRAAYTAATADGQLTEQKEEALVTLAQGLGMTEAHYRGVTVGLTPGLLPA